MTYDDLYAEWNSPANRPSAAETTRLIAELIHRVRRRRSLEKAWLIWSVIALTLITALAGWNLVHPTGTGTTPAWTLVPLIVAPWLVILVSLRSRARRAKPPAAATWPIREALALSYAENQAERRRLQRIAGLFVVMMPLLWFAILQLERAGKLAPHELRSMVATFAIALLAGASAVAWRYFRVLGPEKRRLDELLRAYDATSLS